MKVIHIESGLGNQMLSYCEYLAMQKTNSDEKCYIETVVYEIPECEDVICQWNGYELNRIFGIEVPNIKSLFSEQEWEKIISDIRESEFWEKNWNYPVYITKILKKYGLDLKNIRGDFEAPNAELNGRESTTLKSRFKKSFWGFWIKKILDYVQKEKVIQKYNQRDLLFIKTEENLFTGQRLAFKNKNNGIECIDREIETAFSFSPIIDEKNLQMLQIICSEQSVAIHARRGDMMGCNASYYRYGYFKRAVKYIRKRVENPVFIFFCDPGSVEWCKENEKVFGLDFSKDRVYFVDWNKKEESYRDMQLMAECKHQIITNSSFGWWASYLNKNPNKITISPEVFINTTVNI